MTTQSPEKMRSVSRLKRVSVVIGPFEANWGAEGQLIQGTGVGEMSRGGRGFPAVYLGEGAEPGGG